MPSPARAIRKYLDDRAEPEAGLARRLTRSYQNALVVPAFDETVRLLTGLEPALRKADALCVLVVNATEDAAPSARRSNALLLEELMGSLEDAKPLGPRGAVLGRLGSSDVLILDRSSAGRVLPPGQGVGLARKIGADLALALFAQEQLGSAWIHTTDADSQLPAEYFSATDRTGPDPVALAYPFRHVRGGDAGLDRATAIYEISLRYHVLGLRWAGSPYAFHTVGSTLAVRADAYAAVRGFPRRRAGEDFYLLNKLAKLGAVATPPVEPLRIVARSSRRVPFGTGPAVARIRDLEATGKEHRIYHPGCFAALRLWLETLDRLANHGDVDRWRHDLPNQGPEALAVPLRRIAEPLATSVALRRLCRQHAPGPVLRRHLHGWFDAFRTLKLIHAARDQGFASLPWPEALRAAPHVELGKETLGGPADAIAEALAQRERRILRGGAGGGGNERSAVQFRRE